MASKVIIIVFLSLVIRAYSLPTAVDMGTVNLSNGVLESGFTEESPTDRVQSLTHVNSGEVVYGRRIKRSVIHSGICPSDRIEFRGKCWPKETFDDMVVDNERHRHRHHKHHHKRHHKSRRASTTEHRTSWNLTTSS